MYNKNGARHLIWFSTFLALAGTILLFLGRSFVFYLFVSGGLHEWNSSVASRSEVLTIS